jgi:hypothetical protein
MKDNTASVAASTSRAAATVLACKLIVKKKLDVAAVHVLFETEALHADDGGGTRLARTSSRRICRFFSVNTSHPLFKLMSTAL